MAAKAVAIAIRIARGYTSKDIVAFYGYHGWHDWYLSANLTDDSSLDGHSLPGLGPVGVPRTLKQTAIPFAYNQTNELDAIVSKHGEQLGVIIIEPIRYHEPKEGFLEHLRDAANQTGAVLVFDEITSAWRMTIGGIHLLYGANPDIAIFAKGISNGYPMGAIIGVGDVMQAAQKTSISSIYWTQRIGPTAALATIKKFQSCQVPDHLCRIGNRVRKVWKEAGEHYGLKITIQGIPPLSIFSLDYPEHKQAMCTLFTQAMLDRGFLASKQFYATYACQDSRVDDYPLAVDQTFKLIASALENNEVERLLRGPKTHRGFRRLA